jgi:predicted regulator of amino acid metabolism with ACT domain
MNGNQAETPFAAGNKGDRIMRQTSAQKSADIRIDNAYRAFCSGVQIDIMDIGKVFAVGRKSVEAGDDNAALAQKIIAFVETIRKD